MIILDGKLASLRLKNEVKSQIEDFRKRTGRAPALAVVLVGDDPASHVYVKNKELACVEVGIRTLTRRLDAQVDQQVVENLLHELNVDPEVDGILVQLPLPSHLEASALTQKVHPLKDVDGFTETNLGKLFSGKPVVAPCTPAGVMKLLEDNQVELKGKTAVVVGRSLTVGRPVAELLTAAQATVTLCHSQTVNLSEHTRRADVVVVAAGKPEMLGRDDFKKGAVVVDVGIHRKPSGGITGDVKRDGLDEWLYALSPVPGGVGPMTIAFLLRNTLTLALLRESEKS